MICEEQFLRAFGALAGLPCNLPLKVVGSWDIWGMKRYHTIGFFTWAQPKVWYLLWEGGTENFGDLASNYIKEEISELFWFVLGVVGPAQGGPDCCDS